MGPCVVRDANRQQVTAVANCQNSGSNGPFCCSGGGASSGRHPLHYARRRVSNPVYVHYAAAPIVGEQVLPWSELPDDLRSIAGHQGKAHDARLDQQYRPDLVYIHELHRSCERWADLAIGTAYATKEAWVYEVEPELPIWPDPERGGHLATSRTCRRARVIRCLHWPSRDTLLFAIRGATGRGARVEAARLLQAGNQVGELTTEDLREWLPDTWTFLSPPAGPHGALLDADWLRLFRAMGFFMAEPPIDLGPQPYTIYRAAPFERVHAMSWCTHEPMARSFLPKHQLHGHYRLWRSVVRQNAVLAVLHHPTDSWRAGPTAREVIVDPTGLGEAIEVEG